MAAKLEGVFAPALVPLDEGGAINEVELRRFLSWLIEKGVHGLFPNGSTGEFTRFTPSERRRITEITCEVARGRVPVLAGAAEANVAETLKACETCSGLGARAAVIVAPFYYRLGQEALYAWFAEIARHSPIDITLYNIPLFASPLELATVCRLAEFPRVIGIKDSSGDLTFMMQMAAAIRPHRPDFSLLCGSDALLVASMLSGFDGGVHAICNVVPGVMRRLYDLTRERRLEEAFKLQYLILELLDSLLDPFEFPDGFRAGASLRGFDVLRPRRPAPAPPAEALTRIESNLRRILA